MKPLSQYIDHTILKPDATKAAIVTLCQEAITHQFFSVCVNSSNVPICHEVLKNSSVRICSVVGFPLGAMSTETKAFETKLAIEQGADEIDMVIAIGRLKDQDDRYVLQDIQAVVTSAQGRLVKVIIETCLLTKPEIVKACQLAEKAGAQFVKTSTGFSSGGATVEDVALMRANVAAHMQVKASGGIRNLADFEAMIAAGATRIGTSSGISILAGKTSTSY